MVHKKETHYTGWGILVQTVIIIALCAHPYFPLHIPAIITSYYSLFLALTVIGLPLMIAGPLGGWKFSEPSHLLYQYLPAPILISLLLAGITYFKLEHDLPHWIFIFITACLVFWYLSYKGYNCPSCNMPMTLANLEKRNPAKVGDWSTIKYQALKCRFCLREVDKDFFKQRHEQKLKHSENLQQLKSINENDLYNIASRQVISEKGYDPDKIMDQLSNMSETERMAFLEQTKTDVEERIQQIKRDIVEGKYNQANQ